MDKVVHFEIPAEDVKRAEAFYSKVFGWKINSMPEMNYTIVQSVETDPNNNNMPKVAGAINGGIFKRNEQLKSVNIVMDVSDINKKLEEVKEAGGEIIMEKTPVGDMGFVAYFKDSEGNVLGIWEDVKKEDKK